VPEQGLIQIMPAIQRWALLGWQQQQGRVPQYWREVLDADPLLTDVVMVIELVFGGNLGGASVVRIATEPVRSTSTLTGLVKDAVPALFEEPVLDQVYQLGVGASAARALAFTLDPVLVDPAALVLKGLPLCGVAEVSLQKLGGGDHDRRWVLMRGDIDGSVRFGAVRGPERELMEVEVVDPRASCASKLPPWVVDDTRFAAVHASAVGSRLPLVVNSFQAIPGIRTTSNVTGGNDFVFARGHGFAVSTANGVQVNGITYTSTDLVYAWSLVESVDAHGEPVSLIRFTVAGTNWEDADAVHVTATRANADERDVVGVIQHVVEQHTPLGPDGAHAGLFAEASARLPRSHPQVLINGATGASATTALEWIEGGYLAALPMISMVWEGGRYGPIVTDHRREPMAQWEAGALPLLDRVSLVEETAKAEVFNEFVLLYDYDVLGDVYQKVGIRTADNSDVCRYSRDLFGTRHAEPLEAPYITDDGLAAYVLDWLVEHQALPSYLVQYEAAPSVMLEYRRGDVIALTDSDFGWVGLPATIQGMARQRSKVVVTLRVWARYLVMGGQALSM
jgi:hypothetical protein